MSDFALIAAVSILTAGLSVAFGAIGPALGEGRAAAAALAAIAQQPDSASTLSRTLFVSLAMIESTAIYCFVVAMIVLFANPFWDQAMQAAQSAAG
ncbi:ATP synthase F0 subunit C [Marinobacter sp. EhC06]|jgi:F-type H+-transporting ATPase subunit c|uniref:F0F1 ATP synthase subunit C n=1 Tax=Marinobacter TaxID=2742 RepID=UPI0007DA25B9|nr:MULTISPECIES: F0F1 ATP synthase subunit C [unclassified Marinobacter]MCP4063990.1 F0F1 ATP synthase subunit C [Gammaproteobacteria bacterium]MEC7727064.1 F0F1 ATP synthase subunit C [Pseudomonadota bacterium]MAK47995.1 ATP synthase F0 subunit C [Marinobacter sp.]OAN88157.1 ATP synthase F0 subunit C [Marinobacter sp. EhN04]OAN91140.1 ATP synthase F0 subunit C [Marinobacter sp. EhC06]|tara:strand:- start:427 stop:714 length:288 start_codon:yes stop_codon:yes gene_type:complete